MRLVVQIPALNEERTVAEVIRAIPGAIPGIDETIIVVIDDGSTDRTAELAQAAGAVVLRHEEPRGVGAAFRTGVEYATRLDADIIATIDADGQFNPADIPRLVDPILRDKADFITASRFVDPSLAPQMPRAKRWGNDFMARWISRLVGHRYHDVSCGFRAYSRNAYLRLVLLGDFSYTHETFLSLAFAQVRIQEIPVIVRGVRQFGTSRVAGNLFRYGYRTALIILRTHRDYRPLQFFGHIALVLLSVGCAFLGFLLHVRITTGMFSPHKWAGFVSAAFATAALLVYLAGLAADMLERLRVAQNEILFRVRRLERRERTHKP